MDIGNPILQTPQSKFLQAKKKSSVDAKISGQKCGEK